MLNHKMVSETFDIDFIFIFKDEKYDPCWYGKNIRIKAFSYFIRSDYPRLFFTEFDKIDAVLIFINGKLHRKSFKERVMETFLYERPLPDNSIIH